MRTTRSKICYESKQGGRIVLQVAVCFILLGFFVYSYWGKDKKQTQFQVNGRTMATTFTVKISDQNGFSGDDRKKIRELIDQELYLVNSTMSRYHKDSDIDRFNRYEGMAPFEVSEVLAQVVEKSLEISRLSGGAFDVTVGPLIKLWGFDDKTALAIEPDPELLNNTRLRIGAKHLSTDKETGSLKKTIPGLDVDLSGIAKGFSVDRIAQGLDGLGYKNYLVEVGGEVRCQGLNGAGEVWRVAVEAPLDDRRDIYEVISLKNTTMSTSGDYRNFYHLNGQRVSHTIDPRTGRPISHGLASVTVIHPSCMMADGWATAFSVLGMEEGYALAVKQGLAVLFLQRDGSGFKEKATPAFLVHRSSP